ncbi:putative bifunctional diguanylate cyclase/phosphodiesterase [Gayadomonas joobiniege]|uniref:putative bifunctional diguanylate cyclase/phosphodiesterase n=1 Tax=Gayadomonas joobiniege TaxID=1234606 RepID=UPI000372A4A0|nr:EAL domain-containing protein [Gayadomonas joobiniege]
MQVSLQQLNTAVWVYDFEHGRILWANDSALKLWDSPSFDELSSRDLISEQSSALKKTLLQYKETLSRGGDIHLNWTFYPRGKPIEAFCQYSGIYLDDGRLAMLVEATSSVKMQSNQILTSSAILSNFALNGAFISGNKLFVESFSADVCQLSDLFCHPRIYQQLMSEVTLKGSFEEDILLYTVNGQRWFRVNASLSTADEGQSSILLHQFDIHERKLTEQSLREQAISDPLTGLVNRRGIAAALENRIVGKKHPFALLYIDLDGFKMINDSLGHQVGDEVLIEVSARLKQFCRAGDTLSRFGGDEFILLVEQTTSEADYAALSERIIESVSVSYELVNEHRLSLSASIGVAVFPYDANDVKGLIGCGDAAMYRAKTLGKKCWQRYQHGMENTLKYRSMLAQKLSFAIKNDELEVYYQPIKNLQINTILGFEALLRWRNPQFGVIDPEETIKIAENTGLIHDIENWVLAQAMSALVKLKRLFGAKTTMAVNISGLHLTDPGLLTRMLTELKSQGLTPKDLTIELTESVLMEDLNNMQDDRAIDKLIAAGIRLSIDDFGTGYSSLAHLHRFPASVVKVDRCFLNDLNNNQVTFECIFRLVQSLGMQVLIEGIETNEQAQRLSDLGYQVQQGFYHGRPQPLNFYLQQSEFND